MTRGRPGGAAAETASATPGDELAARVTPPILEDRPNLQALETSLASQWPPLDPAPADPQAFVRQFLPDSAKTLRRPLTSACACSLAAPPGSEAAS